MSRRLLAFSLGLMLGGAAAWFAARPRVSVFEDDAAAPSPAPPFALPAWAWREAPLPGTLTARDADAALTAWLADAGPLAHRRDTLRALGARLPDHLFARLLSHLDAGGPPTRPLLDVAFDLWIERAPADAARWAAAGGAGLRWQAGQALRAWAARDAAAACAWAVGLPDAALAASLAREVLPDYARRDPAAALALVGSRDAAFRDELLPALVKVLAQSDPGAVLAAHGATLLKGGSGFWQIQEPLTLWMKRSPAAALDWLISQPLRDDGQFSHFIGEFTRDHPAPGAFATLLAARSDLPARTSTLATLVSRWTERDPAAALAWLNALPDRSLRASVLEQAAARSADGAEEKSLPLALALPAGAQRELWLSSKLSDWTKRDPSAALAWMRAHPGAVSARSEAAVQGAILATIAADEPQTAVREWQALADGPAKFDMVDSLANAWGKTDPGAALRWRAEQEDRRDKDGSLSWSSGDPLLSAWAQREPLAALRWTEARVERLRSAFAARGLPSPPPNDLALLFDPLAKVSGRNSTPRAAAADLLAQIRDADLRTAALTPHLREWLTKDRAAAQAWLERSDALTPAQAAALLAAP